MQITKDILPKKLLINLLLETSLRISALLVLSLLFKSLWLYRCRILHWTRIDIHASWLTNTLSIHFFWFHDENSIRKRFLALASGEFV